MRATIAHSSSSVVNRFICYMNKYKLNLIIWLISFIWCFFSSRSNTNTTDKPGIRRAIFWPVTYKSTKQLPHFIDENRDKCRSNRLQWYRYHVHTCTVTVSYCRSTWIRYQKSYILVSDRMVYNTNISSQCNLTV